MLASHSIHGTFFWHGLFYVHNTRSLGQYISSRAFSFSVHLDLHQHLLAYLYSYELNQSFGDHGLLLILPLLIQTDRYLDKVLPLPRVVFQSYMKSVVHPRD